MTTKVELEFGTTVEVRGRYYRVAARLGDEFDLSDVKSGGERRSAIDAKFEEVEEVLLDQVVDRLNNLVKRLEQIKFSPRSSDEKVHHARR